MGRIFIMAPKRTRVKKICEYCKSDFEVIKYRSYKAKCCSKECSYKNMAKNMLKDKPGGATQAIVWFRRRNLANQCTLCNYDEYPEILVVHHIDENRHNNNLDNLKILCPNCHALQHRKVNKKQRFYTHKTSEFKQFLVRGAHGRMLHVVNS